MLDKILSFITSLITLLKFRQLKRSRALILLLVFVSLFQSAGIVSALEQNWIVANWWELPFADEVNSYDEHWWVLNNPVYSTYGNNGSGNVINSEDCNNCNHDDFYTNDIYGDHYQSEDPYVEFDDQYNKHENNSIRIDSGYEEFQYPEGYWDQESFNSLYEFEQEPEWLQIINAIIKSFKGAFAEPGYLEKILDFINDPLGSAENLPRFIIDLFGPTIRVVDAVNQETKSSEIDPDALSSMQEYVRVEQEIIKQLEQQQQDLYEQRSKYYQMNLSEQELKKALQDIDTKISNTNSRISFHRSRYEGYLHEINKVNYR